MSGSNKWHAMGRLCRDPEIRHIPSGTAVCEFSIAVESGWGQNKKVCFMEVEVWGKQGEFVDNKFRKGDGIYIIGRINFDTWEDSRTGVRRSKHYLVAQEIHFPVGTRSSGNASANAPDAEPAPTWNNNPEEDEIPF